jgi:glycosyltransferase involved in cell wall biosynthesis
VPCVSIGLPVYNGERYLEEALRSLLGQTWTDFELVIADNASTDRTAGICQAYASRDPRVRYHRNPENIGGSPNHNRVFELSRGRYFVWAAYDDLRAPTYLERCVAVLEKNPEVVVCYSKTRYIDDDGRDIPRPDFDLAVQGGRAHERFRELMRLDHQIDPVLGLIRADVLRRTPLEGQYADCDRVLLAELGLHGRFHEVPEYLTFRREHAMNSTQVFQSRQERTSWFDPKGAGRIVFPYWREFRECFSSIHRVPLPWDERLHCYRHMLTWFVSHRRRLWRDIVIAAKTAASRYARWIRQLTSPA